MKATQHHHNPFIFSCMFILATTVVILLSFPVAQQLLEQLHHFLGDLLIDFRNEIGRNYGV